jgi:hypothetical protein
VQVVLVWYASLDILGFIRSVGGDPPKPGPRSTSFPRKTTEVASGGGPKAKLRATLPPQQVKILSSQQEERNQSKPAWQRANDDSQLCAR